MRSRRLLGFTLIELLVVMTISGVLMAFVGPVAFEQIDVAKAKSEIEKLKGIIRYTSTESYTQGKSVSVKLVNYQIFKDGQSKAKVTFEYISFPEQTLFFNRNGYVNQVNLTYQYKNTTTDINIYHLLGYQDDEFIYAP